MPKHKPRIAVDLDGVCYDWGGTVRYLMRKHRGYDLPPSTHWDYVQETVDEESWRWLWSVGIDLGLFRYGHHIKGSVDGLRALAELGDLEVVTHRPRAALQDTLRFVAGLPDVFSGVHFLSGGENKSSIGCDVYIDDAQHVVAEVLRAGKHAVIFDQPWNQRTAYPDLNVALDPPLLARAFGWDEVPDAVREVLGLW